MDFLIISFRKPPECSPVWTLIRPEVVSCLTWVQTICKGCQQTTECRVNIGHLGQAESNSCCHYHNYAKQNIYYLIILQSYCRFVLDYESFPFKIFFTFHLTLSAYNNRSYELLIPCLIFFLFRPKLTTGQLICIIR